MKCKVLSGARLAPMALVVVLLMAGIVPAAMAQGPDDEGDFQAQAWTADSVRFNPQHTKVEVNQQGQTEVEVVNVLNLYAGSFDFDVAAGSTFNIVDISPGSLFDGLPSSGFIWSADTANEAFFFTLVGDMPPINGTGSIATITWEETSGAAGGAWGLTWNTVNLSDQSGNTINVTLLENGKLEAVASGGAVVTGQLKKQGRNTNYDGTTVELCACTGFPCVSGTTDVQGYFSITAPIGCVDVHAPPLFFARPAPDGWLPARVTDLELAGATFNLGTTVRLAGDVTASGEVSGCPAININDLAVIAGGLYDGVCDSNVDFNNSGGADCDDIFDLALAAANYGQKGYIDWLTGMVGGCP